MRTKIVAGNWKMNKTPSEAGALIAGIRAATNDGDCGVEVVVCVPFTDIPAAAEALKGSKIGLGAQNMHWKESGAYTGEISAAMLKDLGVRYVILGHSERRQYFAETATSPAARRTSTASSSPTSPSGPSAPARPPPPPRPRRSTPSSAPPSPR